MRYQCKESLNTIISIGNICQIVGVFNMKPPKKTIFVNQK